MASIEIKRAYERPAPKDGKRILVDRLWPRGLRKDAVIPDDLQALLDSNEHARQRFERLTAGHRREYIQWIIEAKRPETRQRRLAATIERLTNEALDAPSAPPR